MTYQLNMTSTQRLAITPAAGQAILDTTTDQWFIGNGFTTGGVPITQGLIPNNTIVGNTSGASAIGQPLTVPSIQLFLNQAKQLPRWNAALGRVLSGAGNARMLFIGDSTTLGYESNGSTTGNMKPLSTPTQVSNLLAKSGYPSGWQNFMGNGFASTGNNTVQWDNRLVVGTGWLNSTATGYFVGGEVFTTTNATGSLSFTPTVATDTFVVWYWGFSGSGTLSLDVNGTGTTNHSTSNGTATIGSFTITGTKGMNAYNTKWVSGTLFILGFEAYDSTVKQVSCLNAGWWGSDSYNWANMLAESFVSNFISPLAPDLTVITLGINDWNQNHPVAQVYANIQNIITQATVSGDVIVVSDNLTDSGATQAQQLPYDQSMFGLAYANNYPFIDNWARWNNANQVISDGLLGSDRTHPTGAGYADMARSIVEVIV